MKPAWLRIKAFGPYVEEQFIDFHVFDTSPIFLIQGETGSGKTMLLDAMVYALYGKSSGGQREDLYSMRSRFASNQEDTIVEFQFQLRNHTYRFKRKIQMRKKRNNEWTAVMSVDAGEVIQDEFIPFFENPKLKNVEEKAIELLGLTHDQFVQVMVLPQGKFERLLTSKSEEKQEILRTLFQMERWEKINDALSERMKKAKEELDTYKQRKEALLSGISMENENEIEEWVQKAKVELLELETKIHLKQKEAEQLKNEYTRQQSRIDNEKQLHGLMQKWNILIQEQPSMDKLFAELTRQKKLQQVLPQWNQFTQNKQAYESRSLAVQEAKEKLNELQQQKQKEADFKSQLENSRMQEQSLMKEIAECEKTLPQYEKLQQEVKTKEVQSLQLDKLQQQLYLQQKLLENQKLQEQNLSKQEEEIEQSLLRLQDYLKDQTNWEQAFYHEEQRISLQNKRNEKLKILNKFKDEEKLKQQEIIPLEIEVDDKTRNYLKSSAAQLASTLKEGTPCPVCGSTHHPNLAASNTLYQDVVSLQNKQEELDQLKEEYTKIIQQIHQEEVSLKMYETNIQEHETEIQRLLQHEFIKEKYDKKHQQKKQYEELNKQREHCLTLRNKLQSKQQTDEAALKQIEQEVQASQTQKLLLEQQIQSLRSTLPKDFLHQNDMQSHIQKLNKRLEIEKQQCLKLEQTLQNITISYEKAKLDLEHAEKEQKQAQKLWEGACAIWENICLKQNISNDEMSSLSLNDIEDKEKKIKQFEQEKEQLSIQIKELRKACDQIVPQDIQVLTQQIQLLENDIKTMQKQIADTQSHIDLYEKILSSLITIQKELDVKEPAFVEMAHFVKAMRGDQGMGIERYVLGIMLTSITQQANQLLKLVHNGRYQIYRSDEASGRTRKYGLELSIYDTYTCSSRNVVSLSGGEKFLVSLALSLALSSVVQARNGGIQLDTMFIDEGFGSLDEHSIADALAVLQIMNHHKGYIGIISHVELLKENIPVGIIVEKSREGSQIRIRR